MSVGAQVTQRKPGERVVVPFQIHCGTCERCQRGQTASCTRVGAGAAYGLGMLGGRDEWGGAVCDLLHVPFADAMLVPIARKIDPVAAAALGDNAVDGFRTVRAPLEKAPGAPVLVAGGGASSVGLYAVAAAIALGASRVVYVDPSTSRCELATELGATAFAESWTPSLRRGLFPITVDATSSEEGLRFAIASTEPYGTCTSVGIYFSDVALPLLAMYRRGIHFVTGRVNARSEIPAALDLFARGRMRCDVVVTERVDWDDAARAWTAPATKMVIHR